MTQGNLIQGRALLYSAEVILLGLRVKYLKLSGTLIKRLTEGSFTQKYLHCVIILLEVLCIFTLVFDHLPCVAYPSI
jgi:hypothetical protein